MDNRFEVMSEAGRYILAQAESGSGSCFLFPVSRLYRDGGGQKNTKG
jgi:hypothetical protein